MKIYIGLNIILIALFVELFNACTEPIDIDLEDDQTRLVVYGTLTTDTTAHTVALSKTSNYFDNSPPPAVTGAEVKIEGTDGTILNLRERTNEPGIYETDSNTYGKTGVAYTLFINNVDIDNDGENETYQATDSIRPIGVADSIKLLYFENSFVQLWQVHLFAEEPSGKDYYLFKLHLNDQLYTDTLTEIAAADDQFLDTISRETGVPVQSILSEMTSAGDTITFELNSITEQYYYFFIQLQDEVSGQSPFEGPPSNVITNLNNGAIGFFGTYSIDRASTVVPPEPWRNYELY
jgi:hypothetical protein